MSPLFKNGWYSLHLSFAAAFLQKSTEVFSVQCRQAGPYMCLNQSDYCVASKHVKKKVRMNSH